MSQVIRNVLVIGAGGNLGRHLVDHLLESGFNVSALTRDSSTSTTNLPSSVKVHPTDYTETSLVEAFKDQDVVISTISSFGTVPQVKATIDAAVKAGVTRYIPSEFGLDSLPHYASDVVHELGEKQEVVRYLRTKEKEGVSWTAIMTSMFFDWGLERNLMGYNIRSRKATIYGSADASFSATNIHQITKSIARTLTHLDATKNQYIYIQSFATTPAKVISLLEKHTGESFEINHADVEELAKEGLEDQRRASGTKFGNYSQGIVKVILAALYGRGGLNDFGEKASKWLSILEMEEESLEETVKRLVK